MVGAGGLHSTARDMIRFVAASAGLAETKLQPALADAFAERESGAPGRWRSAWGGTAGSSATASSFGTTAPPAASIPTARSIRKTSSGVVVLSNPTADVDDIGIHLLDLAFPLKEPVKAVVVPEEKLAKLDGWYDLSTAKCWSSRTRKISLTLSTPVRAGASVFAQSPTDFVYKVVPPASSSPSRKTERSPGSRSTKTDRDPRGEAHVGRGGTERARRDHGRSEGPGPTRREVPAERLRHPRGEDRGNHLARPVHGAAVVRRVRGGPRRSFFLKKIDAQLTFTRTSAGKVDSVILHQGGVDQQLPRVP